MTQELSTEDRLVLLESRVAELERQRRAQEDRDIALLARIDDFIDDLRRIERVQMRSFEELKADQQEVKADLQVVKADLQVVKAGQHNLEQALGVVVDTLKNHKTSIETLATRMDHLEAGQQQIIAILTGNLPRND